MLFGEFFKHGVAFKNVIFVGENHHAHGRAGAKSSTAGCAMAIHAFTRRLLWLATLLAWCCRVVLST